LLSEECPQLQSKRKGGSIMASNFRIYIHRNSDSLHLKLAGDFDGTSAFELLDTVKKSGAGLRKVFIHTSDLKTIHAFGLHVFEKCLSDLKGSSFQILFTGQYARQIAPAEGMCV
jgi:anti-anti-sigma regulatory factor